MSSTFCPGCDMLTEVIFDHTAGDTICSDCGLLLHPDSESPNDPAAPVAAPCDPLPSDGGLSAVVSNPDTDSGDFSSSSPHRAKSDRILIQAFKSIASISDRLGLVTSIQDRAREVYMKIDDQKCLRGRNHEAVMAACVYIACRQENRPRTVKEICSGVNGATKKEIGRAKECIVKHLKLEMGQPVDIGTVHAGSYVRRFCSNLGMSNEEAKAAEEAVQKAEELDIRRIPTSIAATVIYMIAQLSKEKIPLKDVSTATRVAEGTIRNSFREIYPHLSRIIPTWFADQEAIQGLHP